jgi:hypothetical protein
MDEDVCVCEYPEECDGSMSVECTECGEIRTCNGCENCAEHEAD